jgi:SOS-response transcriptional repressor LexA
MTSLTPRNFEVLRWFQDFYEEHQFSPTLREIQEGLGFKSIASVQNHIQRLKAENVLVSDPTKARTLRLVQNYDEDTSHWSDPPDQDTSVVVGIPIEGRSLRVDSSATFQPRPKTKKRLFRPTNFPLVVGVCTGSPCG